MPTRFSNKLVSLLIVDNGYAAACMSIGQWDSIPLGTLVFFGLILRNSRTQGQSSRQKLLFLIGKQWQTLLISCSRRMDEMLIYKSLRNLQYLYTSSSRCPKRCVFTCGLNNWHQLTWVPWVVLTCWKAFAIEISSSELRCCSQLSLSENSVPLHPMVNDHYLY